MNTTWNCVSFSAALLAVFMAEPLLAAQQRSPYGGVAHPTYATGQLRQVRLHRPQWTGRQPVVQPRPSHSHEPSQQIAFKPGDQVTVIGNHATLMMGSNVLGSISKGTTFKLTEIKGRWLGTTTEIDGRQVSGWVPLSEVAAEAAPSQPQKETDSLTKYTVNATHEVKKPSPTSPDQGSCHVEPYRDSGWTSSSSHTPDTLNTFQWGWWDLKDRR